MHVGLRKEAGQKNAYVCAKAYFTYDADRFTGGTKLNFSFKEEKK